MTAQSINALVYISASLLNLYCCAILLRIILAWVRADFYNPVSQMSWKLTQPVAGPLGKVIPRYKRFDTAAAVFLLLVALGFVHLMVFMYGLSHGRAVGPLFGLVQALFKIIVLTANLYTIGLTFQAILSWFGPGVNNPASNILWSMNEPILRPLRRIIPPLGGLDLTPLIAIVLVQAGAMLIPIAATFREGLLG